MFYTHVAYTIVIITTGYKFIATYMNKNLTILLPLVKQNAVTMAKLPLPENPTLSSFVICSLLQIPHITYMNTSDTYRVHLNPKVDFSVIIMDESHQ